MGTISSMSPRLAYSDGGLWLSTYDEVGRRCWVNNVTGEITYHFFEGKPVDPTMRLTPNGALLQQRAHYHPPNGMAPTYATMMSSPLPSAHPPTHLYGGKTTPYQAGFQTGPPPVGPSSEGKIKSNPEQFYIRPTFEKGSWMWK